MAFLLAPGVSGGGSLHAQAVNRIPLDADFTQAEVLQNHHPLWANEGDSVGVVAPNELLDHLTLVLSRSPQQELAFEKFLASQQDRKSPNYHHWLTPAEVGTRFGLSKQDIATVSSWLQSQGLHVNWVSPSRIFIGFGGAAADVGRAFHTELHTYRSDNGPRMSVSSDPMIPVALAPAIKAVRGLYTVEEEPLSFARSMHSSTPDLTLNSTTHFITPADFATIYDLPQGATGAGQAIGIVGQSRTDSNDFFEFRLKTGTGFADPTEIVPTAFGGVDPGPPYTAPPAGNVSLGDQLEATLDVMRAGSVARQAQLLLVVATSASGGIATDAQYLVQSSPVPAQVMNISFGGCEAAAGPSGVNYWDALFQQAAAEGISVFVSSGDSGASGCDAAFATPPASPAANSPNYICSSSYATCVGGTEFNDTGNPSQYWSSTNTSYNLESALSYIPEGGWNEPLDSKSNPRVASSGGGVSSLIATPSWQAGTGVPSARAGRYTPDIAFSSSGHDGYFACFAASAGNCVNQPNGSFEFEYFFGTSAAAPSMAGITALLDQKLGVGQGNLNPELYHLAAASPASFHDTTVASSGVSGCSVNTPSMCNNSIPGTSGLSGGQAGYVVTAGYDEVTGLGSLDVSTFLDNYVGIRDTPTLLLYLSPPNITTAQPLAVSVSVAGTGTGTPTGTLTLTGGGYTSPPVTLTNGYANFNIAANALAVGTDTLTAVYTPDTASAAFFNPATGTDSVTVSAVGIITPFTSVELSATNIVTAESLPLTVAVEGGTGPNGYPNQLPSGTIQLRSGGYKSPIYRLPGGEINVSIPAQALAPGSDTVTAAYTPDAASSPIYTGSTGSSSVTVTVAPKDTPSVGVVPTLNTLTVAQVLPVSVYVSPSQGYFGNTYQIPTGSLVLSSGAYVSATTRLQRGVAKISIPAGALAVGSDTLTANYTPDGGSSKIYNSSSGSSPVTVTTVPKTTPTVQVTLSASSIVAAQPLLATVVVNPGTGNPTPTGTLTLAGGGYSSASATLANGAASINIPGGSLAVGSDTLTATYTPDAASSAAYNGAAGTGQVTVSPNPPPSFAITGMGVSLLPGAASGNTATLTVTPSGGFTGSVALTAAVTSSPAGAQDPPTFSFGSTSPISVTGASAVTATLTISTTAATSAALADPLHRRGPWYAAGGASLACLLLFGIPARRRRWRGWLGMLVLLAAFAGGMLACGGGGGGGETHGTGNPGTTSGSYTVTVTGASGTTVAKGTVTLTVQ